MTLPFVEKRLLSLSEYHKMAEVGILKEDDRVELLYGEITQMSPITSEHAGQVNQVVRTLQRELSFKETIVSVQNPISIPDLRSEPEPDISVLKFRKDLYRKKHPLPEEVLLLIEVAVTTLKTDRKIKAPLYAQAGIPELWIITPLQAKIEVYKNPKEGEYRLREIYRAGDKIVCKSLAAEFDVAELLG